MEATSPLDMPDEIAPFIHPAADVSEEAVIGHRTKVWDLARIREGAVLGHDCIVGRGAYVDAGVRIGDFVKIQNNALVYHGTTVGSRVFIGPAAILTNDRFPRSTVDGRLAAPQDWIVSEVRLADGCSVGAGAVVVAGSDIGRHASVGAGAVVTHSVSEHMLVVGNPARLLGWVCSCGRRLTDDEGMPVGRDHAGSAVCAEDGERYMIVDGRCRSEAQR